MDIRFSEVSLTDFVRSSVFFPGAGAEVPSWCLPLKETAEALELFRLGRGNPELPSVSLPCLLVLE